MYRDSPSKFIVSFFLSLKTTFFKTRPQFCETESSSKGLEKERERECVCLNRYDSTRSLLYIDQLLLRAISCLACYAHV